MGKTRQISITLPEDLIDTIKAAVDRGAPPAGVASWAEGELDRALGEQATRGHDGGAA